MFDLFSKIGTLVAAIRAGNWPGVEAAVLAIAGIPGAGGIAAEFDKLLAAIRSGHAKAILIEAGAALMAVGQLLPDSIGRGLAYTPSPMADRQSE